MYVPTLPCFLSFFLILYMYGDRTQNTEIRLNSRDSIRDILHKTTLFDSSIERGILRRSTNGVVSSPFLSLPSSACLSVYILNAHLHFLKRIQNKTKFNNIGISQEGISPHQSILITQDICEYTNYYQWKEGERTTEKRSKMLINMSFSPS